MSKQSNRNVIKNPRSSHTGKSSAERKYYTKAIKELRIEPTLDESLDFHESDDLSSDFTVPENTKKRPVSLKYHIKEHVVENWYFWVPSVVVTIVIPWFFNKYSDHNDRLIKTETHIEFIQKTVDETKDDLKTLSEKVTNTSSQKHNRQ